ncbi:tape measure protein [Bacteroides sp. An269]|uniref:tape measure protein n=1 Tax=Bacteroides sp. An269 TaxID=1965613 RepID=UPI000B38F14B|nr:tape measure protein [Bacteroides sp. An269]OUO85337.1 hypothetical protein B5F71_00895 [Bacteroides sp. An269]
MENIGGALAFKATLDIDDFKVSSEAMGRYIKNASDNAVLEANRMEQSFLTFAQNGARYIVSYLVGQGMMSLVQSIVQVRGQFQQLELAFNTMLRSTEKSQVLMSQLVDTAAKTPFDLTSIAQGAKQMLAFGSNVGSVVDEIVMLGNVASGVSAPLGDLIYLYGTLRSQGRAYTVDIRQFAGRGIPIYEELGKVLNADRQELNKLVTEGKVGFPEVEKAFKNMTSEGGIYFNLMQEQSKSLTGMLSNLGDAWDSALNKIGQDNQDLFTGAIQGAIDLVENMDQIIRIVQAVTIAYGSYKAAIVLNTLATKGYTGVAMIDNTVKQAKIALLKAEANITGQTAAQTKAMTAAQQAHVAALQKELTAEEQANLVKKLRIATIQQLLTAQQQEYLSNLNLTTSSANYEAVATSVLTVEQREALSKTDLSAKSAVYRAALEQEVAAKQRNNAATLEAMRTDVKAAAQKVESAKQTAVSAMQATEMARYELYWARQAGDATRIATAEKKLEAAQDNQSAARKAALAAQTDLYTKRKQLEAAAIQQSRIASSVDTAAKAAQATTTNVLTLATSKLTASFKALWLSMKANPITWVVSLVGMAFSAISMLSSKTKELEEDTVSLTNSTKRATERFSEEAGKVEALEKIIRNSNVAYDERNKALNELKQIIPGYNAELTKEGTIINDNADAIQRYLSLLEKQIRMKAAQEELEAAYREKRLKEKEIIQKQAAYDEASANVPDVAYGDAGAQYQMYALRQAGKAERQLKQAQKELTDINKTIEALNQEISDTSGEIDKSSESAKTYSEQIADTRTQIATLTKELEDLRSGKVVKDNLAGEIDAKIKELNTAKKNLELLTGITSSGNSSNSANQLSQKELEAQRELEEARISIMEDGYEKRKAILDLQHKENLDRIDREERELEKARKAAGKGGLTATEQAGFDERRSIENTSYQREQNKLFDGEIAYKKQQYELYFRWVRNLGEDVANTQFANLLKGGASFKQYLENQIAEMNQKKEAGTLTEGEGNHLISLNMQYDEITGAKSAMDLFKESVTEAISQASTLAERVQAIADAKERLVSGSTGLVGEDEKAEASLFISEKQAEADKEIQDKILNNYRSYEEQKKAIQDEYAMLRSQAIAQNNEEILKKLNEGENEALSALNASFLMQSESWRNLFTDLDALTVEQIDKLVRDIQSKMNTSDMNLNPADMKAVLDRLDEAKQKILDVNPFKSLGNAIKSVFGTAEQKSKHSSGNIKTDWKNLASATEGCFNFVNDAIDSCDVLGDLLGETGKSTIQMIQGVATAGIAMSAAIATAEKGSVILAAISIALQAIQWIAGLFNNDDELEERIQNIQMDVDKLSNAFDRLQHSYDQTFWVYSEEERTAHQQRVQAIEDEIAALEQQKIVARQSWDLVRYAQLTKQIKELKNALEKEQNSGDMFEIYELQKQNLREQQELIKQQIQAEKDKKDTDNNKIAEWEEAIKDIDTQIEDLERNMLETLAGTDVQSAIDDFADALVDAYCQGEDAAKALGEVTKETLKNAVVEALKRQFLAKAINDAVLYLGEAMQDNVLSDYEKKRFEEMVKLGADKFNMALEGVGDWIKDQTDEEEESDPLTGAVTSMSEETGGVIAGRLNAFVINQSDQIAIMRQYLIYQIEIAENTRYCRRLDEIADSLKRIENKDNSLLSQGIS